MDQTVIDYGSLYISGAAAIVAILSFYFAMKSWRESNRPIVVARVTTREGGNIGTALDLILENSGNRPAKNVRLTVNRGDLDSVLMTQVDDPLRSAVERCFLEDTFIPVLENCRRVSNSFGIIGPPSGHSTWQSNSVLSIRLNYEDLDCRKFCHEIPLLLTDDTGFAGTFWRPA